MINIWCLLMLLKTTIFNRNFYPIKVYKLEEKILCKDKINDSTTMYINDTTFNNHVGMLIKPFQDIEQLTSVSLNENETDFNGVVYLDSTIYTNSIDYGTFGILTGQKVNIKHKFVTVKAGHEFSGGIDKKTIEQMDSNALFNIKFSMKDIEDWETIYNQLKLTGFSEYIIEKFDFFGDGIYGTTINPKPEGCANPLLRSGVAVPTSEIKDMMEVAAGHKYEVQQEKDNIQFELLVRKDVLTMIYSKLTQSFKSDIDNIATSQVLPMPLYQWPLGMSVILQMKTINGPTPYKLNLKITVPFLFIVEIPEETKQSAGSTVMRKLNNLIFVDDKPDLNTLLCLPEETTILSHPASVFNAHIKLIPFSLQMLLPTAPSPKDSFYEITNVSQDTTDSFINNKISFITDTYPVKKIIPLDINLEGNNKFDIFIDTTDIHSDYTNTISVDYIYDSTSFNLKTDVIVKPILPAAKPVIYGTGGSIFFENSTKYHPCVPSYTGCIIYDTFYFNVYNNDTLHFSLYNQGEVDATIAKVELENPYIQLKELQLKQTKTQEDLDNIIKLQSCITHYEQSIQTTNAYYNSGNVDSTTLTSLLEKESINNFLTYKTRDIKCPNSNLLGISDINVIMDITFFKKSNNYINGIPIIIKVTYGATGDTTQYTTYVQQHISFSIDMILGEMTLMYNKDLENIKYIRPSTSNTIFIDLFKTFAFPEMWDFLKYQHSFGINIIRGELVNYDTDDYAINVDDINIDRSQFPLSIPIISSSNFYGINYDLSLDKEDLYKYKIRLYTNYQYVPYIDIPLLTMVTNLDIEEVLQFDNKDFYVRNNKYFLSLVKLQAKERLITIQNTSTTDIEILEISYFNLKDKFGTTNVDIEQLNTITFPYKLTSKNSLKLDLRILGKDFGHYNSFIILKTAFGDAYLQIASFINTKYKDVYVLMENAKGTNFVSALNGADIDYIKLTNFGDQESLLQISKLGYNQDEFLIENIEKLYPNTINYIENIFVPTSTGKKIGQIDFKIRDMLETFRLVDTDDQYVFKIQNSHILAEMVGISLAEHALPHFSKSVVDFGFISYDKKSVSKRIDTFTIKNYGLTPFVITNISKLNNDSPFTIPLIGIKLPLKVDKEITLPIYINNEKLVDNQKVYIDVFKFEIQDLKTKRIFNHEIITKVELSENNREYVSFNSEFIEFGYCEINNFKVDDLNIKNFSTDKITVDITYNGDVELQTLDDFSFNLWPNQQFNVPIYFYPHGIDTFNGVLTLDFNKGNYIKNIDLFGYGVDFKSPKITVENKMAEYYKTLKNYLGKNKYL